MGCPPSRRAAGSATASVAQPPARTIYVLGRSSYSEHVLGRIYDEGVQGWYM